MEQFNESAPVNSDIVAEGAIVEDNNSAAPENQAENNPASEGEEKKEGIKVEEKKEEDAFSKKFAALSRKERQIRQREAQLNAKMAEMEAKLKALESPKKEEVKQVQIPLEKRLKQNPLDTLKELGLSYEKLTELALNDGRVSVEDKIELMREELESKHQAEIEAIKNELIERDKKTEKQKYNEVIQNFMTELTDFVNVTPDYELIRANDAVSLVYDVIEQHHANTGRILSLKDASDHVESYLFDEAQKLLKLKKLSAATAVAPKKEPVPQNINKPTLTNNSATTLSNKSVTDLKSDDELKKAAAALLKWD